MQTKNKGGYGRNARRVFSFLLSLVMVTGVLSGCVKTPEPVIPEVSFVFSGEVDDKITLEYSGQKVDITVTALIKEVPNTQVEYIVQYLSNNGDILSHQPVNAGEYKISVAVADQKKYTGSRQIPFVIQKKSLTINAQAIEITEGDIFQPDYSINGMEIGDVNVEITYDGLQDKPSAVGNYTITFKVVEDNYAGVCTVPLTIKPRSEVFNFMGENAVYDGTAKGVTIAENIAGLTVSAIYYQGKDGTAYERSQNAPTDAGTYTVTAELLVNGVASTAETVLTISMARINFIAQKMVFSLGEAVTHQLAFFDTTVTLPQLEAMLDIYYTTASPSVSAFQLDQSQEPDTQDPQNPKDQPQEEPEPVLDQITEEGVYTAHFTINSDNYYGATTTTYTILNDVPAPRLTGLDTVYGHIANIGVTPEVNQIKEISYLVDGELVQVQPRDAGEYEVAAVIVLQDESEITIYDTLTIWQKEINFTVENKRFVCGDAITDTVNLQSGINYTVIYSQGCIILTQIPPKAGIYTVTVIIDDDNYYGSATATYTLLARKGASLFSKTVEFTGLPIAVEVEGLGEHHTNRLLTYQGENYPVSQTPPVNAGVYTVVFTCLTDGEEERYECTLTITKFKVSVDLGDMNYEKGETYAEGTPYALPQFTLPDGESIQILFDDFTDNKTPCLPGEYNYTVHPSANIQPSVLQGSIKILITDTLTAYEYGEYYFNNATDYHALSYGTVAITETTSNLGNDTTYNFTEKFKTSNINSPLTFSSTTANGGRATKALGNTIDARMALETYIQGDVANWRGGFKAGAGTYGGEGSGSGDVNKSPHWNAWTAGDKSSAPFTVGLTGEYKNGAKEELKDEWFIDFTKLNNYNITQETISAGIGDVLLSADNKYEFTLTLKQASHDENYKKQLEKFAEGTGAKYTGAASKFSLSIAFTADIFGRITKVVTTDKYQMKSGSNNATTTIICNELINYDTDYIISLDKNGNPYAEQRGDGAEITALAPSLFVIDNAKSVAISTNGGTGDYSYQILTEAVDGGTVIMDGNMLVFDTVVTGKTGVITVQVTDNNTLATTTVDIKYSTVTLQTRSVSFCVAQGTLITLADGSKVAIERLKGDEMLLVFNHATGLFDVAPIVFLEAHDTAAYQIIHLYFSDGTDIKVIYEHAFFDATLNRYVYINADNYASFIGHYFNKQITNADGALTWTNVQLIDVQVYTEVTRSYNIISYGHFNLYSNDMLSVSALTEWLTNIFSFDADTLRHNQDEFLADIQKYGLFTYEEFCQILPVSKQLFEAFNGQYLKVSLGKGLIDKNGLNAIVNEFIKYMLVNV